MQHYCCLKVLLWRWRSTLILCLDRQVLEWPLRWLCGYCARRGGVEVAGWTLDRKIQVRFPAYPHRVWALWWQGGKRRLRTSRCPCRGRLGTLKTPSCPWRGCPAAGQNLETGHLSRHFIAEISLNVMLNHNQQQHWVRYCKIISLRMYLYDIFKIYKRTYDFLSMTLIQKLFLEIRIAQNIIPLQIRYF